MPAGEGFEKGGLNPILIESEECIKLKSREDQKGKDKSNVPKFKEDEVKANSFTPNFLRPVPEIEEVILPEPIWLTPGVLPEPYWDFTLGNDVSRVKTLMKKAHLSPLNPLNKELI
jgi:hypothetical protein